MESSGTYRFPPLVINPTEPNQTILNNQSDVRIYLKKDVAKYRVVAKELAVAAVAVLPILLVGGGGGAGAPLRAAVLILPLLQLRRGVTQRPVGHLVPLTRLIPVREAKKKTRIQ